MIKQMTKEEFLIDSEHYVCGKSKKYICTKACFISEWNAITYLEIGDIVEYMYWRDDVGLIYKNISHSIEYKTFIKCFISLADWREEQINNILDGD